MSFHIDSCTGSASRMVCEYNGWMVKTKVEPVVKWIETHTGIAAQQALSERVKRAKIARKTPTRKIICMDDS